MTEIPITGDSSAEKLQCTTCLLPIQYQTKRNGKFIWRCFKCGKQYIVSENVVSNIEESRDSPEYNTFDIESIVSENQKLRSYISLVFAETELTQRIADIKQNFADRAESERIIAPILDRISKIHSEKLALEQELHLN